MAISTTLVLKRLFVFLRLLLLLSLKFCTFFSHPGVKVSLSLALNLGLVSIVLVFVLLIVLYYLVEYFFDFFAAVLWQFDVESYDVVTTQFLGILVFRWVEHRHSSVFQDKLVASALARLCFNVEWSLNGLYCHLCPQDCLSYGDIDLGKNIKLVDSFEKVMVFDFDRQKKVTSH